MSAPHSSSTTMMAHAFNTPQNLIEFSCLSLCCIIEIIPNLLLCLHFTCRNWSFQDGILWNTFPMSSTLAHFCINVNQAIPNKSTWVPSTFIDLLMGTFTLFKHNYANTCIQHLKNVTKFNHTPLCPMPSQPSVWSPIVGFFYL